MPEFNAKAELEIGQKRNELIVLDTTGIYNPPDNIDGFGNGITNPAVTDINVAYLNLYFADGSQSLNNSVYNPVIPFPNTTNVSVRLYSEDMTTPQTVYPDGKNLFQYILEGEWEVNGQDEAILSIHDGVWYNYANVKCCVQQAFARVDPAADPCKDENWRVFTEADRLLRGLINAIECKNYNKADVILASLQEFCNTNKINCGC